VANWLYALLIDFIFNGWQGIHMPMRGFMQIVPKFLSIYFVWALICGTSGIFFQSIKNQTVQTSKQELDKKITLYSENQSDNFRIRQEDIICFKTCDNYLQLYYLNHEGHIQNRLIRSSMKRMMVQLDSKAFFRCHQSYLVNKSHIQGLNKIKNQTFLELSHLDFDVSIARDNVKHVKSLLAS
jgi:DNA-binding LytR/AlgR family response regulator